MCISHSMNNTRTTIGYTFHPQWQKYAQIKYICKDGSCLACKNDFRPGIHAFCYACKAPRPLDWTTGNKSLDSVIIKSWHNTKHPIDSYLQWIKFSQLTNIQEALSLNHGCTYTADWLELTNENTLRRVMLKKIVDGRCAQSFDFYQVTYSLCR